MNCGVPPLCTLTHHTHTLTSHDAVRQHEDVDVRREGAENEGGASHDATRYAHSATSELVRQRTNDGPCNMPVNIKLTLELTCVVASNPSRSHLISEKHKTVQSFKLHFLQNCPLVQLYTSASDCEGVGNIPGSHF